MISDPLQVEFIPAAPGGEIEAHYDARLGMLLFESRRARTWPHGATIDGILTLDLDADHVLAHGEFGWLRERWPHAEVTLPPRAKGRFAARLAALTTSNLTASLQVRPCLTGGSLIIQLSGADPTHRFSLGPTVDALAADGTLSGLVVANP